MKVLFVSSGNGELGISPIIKNQGESLKRHSIFVDYFTINGKGLKSYINHIFLLRNYLRKHSYDIIHSHYSLSSFVASLAGSNPLVVSLMGSDTQSGPIEKLLIKLFSKLFWKDVIVKTDSMKRAIRITKAKVIPNGVDIDKIQPVNLKTTTDSSLTILFAANPKRKVKNYNLAESAMKKLNDPKIIFKVTHDVSHEEIIRQINCTDVLLLTSFWEGSPNIIKEAMACNCPVVATNVGDVRWLFGNEPGHYITSFDAQDVADNIRLALDFSELHGRTNGRKRILQLGLDADSTAQKIINVYKRIMA